MHIVKGWFFSILSLYTNLK